MKLGSFSVGGRQTFGIVRDDGVVDLGRRTEHQSLQQLLEWGISAAERFKDEPADHALDAVVWLPPILHPMHIIGIGLNTKSHFEETAQVMNRTPGDYPEYPRLFMRSPKSLVGHGSDITISRMSEKLDYEGEIAIVIGMRCRQVAEEDALKYIAGVTIANDGSVRDYQFHSNQVTAGKNFHASGAIGPWIVTSDEIGDFDKLELTTRINGEVRQRLTMDDLLFSFARLIHYITQIYELEAGDIILTGSPAGIGALHDNWLKDSDEVEIDLSHVGTLRNRVVSAA